MASWSPLTSTILIIRLSADVIPSETPVKKLSPVQVIKACPCRAGLENKLVQKTSYDIYSGKFESPFPSDPFKSSFNLSMKSFRVNSFMSPSMLNNTAL
jgi:hypothetical protein